MKLTILNHTYEIKRLRNGKLYLTRTMTLKAFAKLTQNYNPYKMKSGIVNIKMRKLITIIVIVLLVVLVLQAGKIDTDLINGVY